jgi:predicted Zn-dependent peptidase
MHYEFTTLSNGLRIITEAMPDVRSVAVGCWVDTGTRDEHPNEEGASHFLEHLLFKGSEELSAREISEAFDEIGAQANAFTSKEHTCFWARLLDEDLPRGVELLAEMLLRPAFRPEDIDAERQVVIEEINMNEDDPADTAHEQFFQAVFRDHPLERPVLGTRESIKAMRRDDLAGYWQRRYHAPSTVIALAGRLDHRDVVALVEERFGDWDGAPTGREHRDGSVEPHVRVVERDTEQANLILGGRGPARDDDRRYAAKVMNQILGGGLSSRLFQKIREERGLAYAVYSFRMPFADAGAWGVYVGTTPSLAPTTVELILEELDRMVAEGVTEDELRRAKGALRGGLAISLEDANSRMMRLGRAEVAEIEHLSTDDLIARFEAVTRRDVQEVAEEVLTGPRVMGAVGPFSADDLAGYVS